MDKDEAIRRAEADRDAAEDERDDVVEAAKDFAKALQQVIEPDADVYRIATEAPAASPRIRHPVKPGGPARRPPREGPAPRNHNDEVERGLMRAPVTGRHLSRRKPSRRPSASTLA